MSPYPSSGAPRTPPTRRRRRRPNAARAPASPTAAPPSDPPLPSGPTRATRALGAALALCALAANAPLAARESDLSQPIDVSANRSEYDERAGTQTLIGDVEISQGTMRIRADRVAITLEGSRLARIDGEGSPIRFEQENEAGELMRGEAREISYEADTGTLVLSGAATLAQPGQSLASERIVFDAETQKVSAEGGGSDGGGGGRVSIRIEPPSAGQASDEGE